MSVGGKGTNIEYGEGRSAGTMDGGSRMTIQRRKSRYAKERVKSSRGDEEV